MRADTVLNSAGGGIFFWNVDAPVGHNGANQTEDVLFVSWCMYKAAQVPALGEDLKAAFKNVGLTHLCNGQLNDPLVVAIYALQRALARGGLVDGRVSPAKGARYTHHRARHIFLIFELNAYLRTIHPDKYPRIDLMPEFPWKLKEFATAPFIG